MVQKNKIFLKQFHSDHENNQQDALYRFIYYSNSVLHVSDNVFPPSSGTLDCIYSILWCSLRLLPAASRQQLG